MLKELNNRLRLLPAVHEAVSEISKINEIKEQYDIAGITWAVRKTLERAREIISNRTKPIKTDLIANQENESFWDYPCEEFVPAFWAWLKSEVLNELNSTSSTLKRLVNGTGVILHTNCGRALLAPEAASFAAEQAVCYSSLELDIISGNRGSRYLHVEGLLTGLTGAEASLVVNNNAAAVLLIMNTFARGREVIVSRGELVEVGGSFRIPEVLAAGGARLVEVGTTNKTWLQDYKKAVTPDTALLLKVHTSNYRIEGFQHSVSTKELVELGEELGVPVIEDLGSGSLLDGTEFGLPKEPTIQETVKAGVSLVTFSGDKLLGGPQAGIIIGKKQFIERLKNNQLTRALRVDKLTLAALAATLRIYQRGEAGQIPVWRMLSKTQVELRQEAERLQKKLTGFTSIEVDIIEGTSRVGGGAFPTAKLPTVICAIKSIRDSAAELEQFLRRADIPILVRIAKEKILIDPRTLLPGDDQIIIRRLEQWDSQN